MLHLCGLVVRQFSCKNGWLSLIQCWVTLKD